MNFEEKRRLQSIYDSEITQRLLNPAESKVYSESTRTKYPDISNHTFGCVELLPYLQTEFQDKQGIQIMDFGCGAGSDLALYYRELPINGAVGLDISEKMIQQAQTLFEPIEWINGDHFDLIKIDHTFDCITSNAVIHLMQNKFEVLQNLFSKLKHQGILISAEFVTNEPLPSIFLEHYKDSDGLFLFGGLVDRDNYLNLHFDAGFEEVEVLKKIKFNPKPEIKSLLSMTRPGNYQVMMKLIDEIEFEILVTRSQKELASEQVAYKCVKCDALQVASKKFYRSLNCQVHKNLVKSMDETQWSKCRDCNNEQFMAPFQVHEMHAKKMAFCFPSDMENDKQRLQVNILEPFNKRLPHYKMVLCFHPIELTDFLGNI